jgi:hypothetical protein
MVASQIVALLNGIPDGLASVGIGLWGVVLARWVFVNRENRALARPQSWRDTLPLTLTAMLITGVLVHEGELSLSGAAFTGLGVGWAAVLLLDVLGERILAVFRAGFAAPLPPHVEKRLDHSGEDGQLTSSIMEPDESMRRSLEQLNREPYDLPPGPPRDTPGK